MRNFFIKLCSLVIVYLPSMALASPQAVDHPQNAWNYLDTLEYQLLPSVFIVEPFSFAITPTNLSSLISEQGQQTLKSLVSEAVITACLGKGTASDVCQSGGSTLPGMPSELLTGKRGAERIAKWLYNVDYDNWFSYEGILLPSSEYLERPNRWLLYFPDFSSKQLFTSAIPAVGLPVVIDLDANTMTFWTAELFD